MKKITSRTVVCFILALFLVVGTGFFTVKFCIYGNTWASYTANKHLYTSNDELNSGRILDRNKNVLAYYNEEKGTWSFAENINMRKATLHSVGDRDGMIGTGALKRFASKLTGYNLITGSKPIISNGRDLILTIDGEVCKTAYEALQGRKGAICVYNYKTGEIICMVSAPAFDPENPPKIEDTEEYEGIYMNRLISSTFTPGSTFKIITATAALEEIHGIKDRRFVCTGKAVVGGQQVTCPSKHGEMSFSQTLANSCNCTFAELAVEMGEETMKKYVEQAGLTSTYSINGINTVPSTFDFSGGELPWSAVGQGKDLVNPISLMVYCGAVANGGYAAEPQIIKYTSFKEGVRTSIYVKHNTECLVSETASKDLKEMMRNDVVEHYGQNNFPGLNIGAKSGTAQIDSTSPTNAWFTGFLEDERHPYAFIVFIEGGGAGASAAGSAANKVLQKAIETT